MPIGQPDVDVGAGNAHPQPDDPPVDGPGEPGQLDTVPQEVEDKFFHGFEPVADSGFLLFCAQWPRLYFQFIFVPASYPVGHLRRSLTQSLPGVSCCSYI